GLVAIATPATSASKNPPNGPTWAQESPAMSPPARSGAALGYFAPAKQVVLFGGNNGTSNLNDTWIWDGATWTQQSPTTSPSPRTGAVMAYDEATRQLVLFGGSGNTDTWAWDGTNWNQLSPMTSPQPRIGMSMTYDDFR